MALLAELTTQEKTDIRSDAYYRCLQFLCIVPNQVVVQFQPDTAPATTVYAEITVGSVASGSMANIKEAQDVIFSTTSDYQQTEVFRTRVRVVDGTAILYVAENSQGLTTAMYVTVLNHYSVHEKLQKSLTYRDWDITFRKLLPIETVLPSAVVLTNGVTSYQPPAAPIVMDAGASSIDIHEWESSNANDMFSATDVAQPTITLEAAAFRYLRYTFTDDNGNSNFRVMPVWTIPKNYSYGVHLGVGSTSGDFADISFDAELGWTCSVPAFDDIENVINRAFCVVACDEWYNGLGNDDRQSIRTNINFVGYLQNESTRTEGDEDAGHLSETRFTIEGFGHQMSRQNISTQTIIRVTSNPNQWGEIQDPTPARMLTYHLSEGSTLFYLCSLAIPADDGDFVGDDLSITNGKVLDDVVFISEVINAELQFDADGRLDLCRNLIYLDDTARDAADTVVEFLTSDVLSYDIAYNYGSQTSSLEMSGGSFNTSTGVYNPFKSAAPAVARLSEGDLIKITNQVLTTDATAAEARTELGQRAANYFAANQPNYILTATLKDEWYFLVPDVGVWFTFPLTEADTVRGKVFSSSNRWQLENISYSTNNLTGRRQVNAVFRLETQSTGAMVYTTAIQNDPAADIYYLPAVTSPYSGATQALTDDKWYDSQDPTPPSEETPPGTDCENGGIRIQSGVGYTTARPALNGEDIALTLRGSGIITTTGGGDQQRYYEHDFAGGADVWTITRGSIGGTGIEGDKNSGNDAKTATAQYVFASPVTIYGARIVVTRNGGTGNGTFDTVAIRGYSDSGFSTQVFFAGGGFQSDGERTTCDNETDTIQSIRISANVDSPDFPDNSIVINSIELWLSPDAPIGTLQAAVDDVCNDTPSGSTDIYGDAFYYGTEDGTWQAYGEDEGFLFKGSQPVSIPLYSPTHEYVIFENVASGVIDTEFNSPYSLSGAENWSLQLEFCFLGVPS